jgi:hypothetical protein
MKTLSNNQTAIAAIRTGMVLLLAATAATPRGIENNRSANAAPVRTASAPASRSAAASRQAAVRPARTASISRVSNTSRTPVSATTNKVLPKPPVSGNGSSKISPKPPVSSNGNSKVSPKPPVNTGGGNNKVSSRTPSNDQAKDTISPRFPPGARVDPRRPTNNVVDSRPPGGARVDRWPPIGARVDPRPPVGPRVDRWPPIGARVDPRPPMGKRVDTFVARNVRDHRVGHIDRRPVMVHGHRMVEHTFMAHGHVRTEVFRPFAFRGVELMAYYPRTFHAPGFYTWVDTPWVGRVHYRWAWMGSPWFAFYRGYFTPEPVYTSPTFWLTDYLLATSLQEAYQDAAATGAPVYRRVGLTPPVKQSVALEVRRLIAQERSEAAGAVAVNAPLFLDGRSHTFVANASLTVDAGGQACTIAQGDVLQLGAASVDGTDATVQVLASQPQDCQAGSLVAVTVDQLQDMQNHMRELIDQGLAQLRAEQGRGGLPLAPVAALPVPVPAVL